MSDSGSELRAGAQSLGLALNDFQVDRLLRYASLLQKWGSVYNLTALRSEREVVTHHLLDSLSVVRPLVAACAGPCSVLDVGSGAGLPGVVIAIACPEIAVTCVDAVAKKAAFIRQVAGALQLGNLEAVHARVEKLDREYEVVTSRAFSSLSDFVSSTSHVVARSGVWMAMKGKFPEDEASELPPNVVLFHVEQLQVPGLSAQRCLVWMRQKAA